MAFNIGGFYGPGNWKIPGTNIRLPEMGRTEALGGNQNSLKSSNVNAVGTALNYAVPKVFGNSSSTTTSAKNQTDTGDVYGVGTKSSSGGSSSSSTKSNTTTSGGDDSNKQFKKDLDSAFSNNYNFLNQMENTLRGQQGEIEGGINTGFNSQIPLYGQARDQGINAINAQTGEAQTQQNNILNSARQLYNELGQRNTNLFGTGALSSVGQAASEIGSREAQRNFGNIRQNFANTIQTLQTKAQEIEQNYNVQVQNLEFKRQQALSQARAEFQQRLMDIQSQRGQLESWKTQEKLDALKSYRDQQNQISAEARQFAYQMEALRQNSLMSVQDELERTTQFNQQAVGQGQDALQYGVDESAQDAQDFDSANVSYGTQGYDPYSSLTGGIGGMGKKNEEQNVLNSARSMFARG